MATAKAMQNWIDGYRPYADALRKLKLPRKYKPNDPRNIKRVLAVAVAMHDVKVKLDAKKKLKRLAQLGRKH